MLFPASDMDRGISCGKRSRVCPMEVDGMDNARKRKMARRVSFALKV